MKAIIKPQYVDHIPKAVSGRVLAVLEAKTERDNAQEMIDLMGQFANVMVASHRFDTTPLADLRQCLDRDVGALSGGELQRFAIAIVCVQLADIYMFDEPSSYLDVKQRLGAARVIRSLLQPTKWVWAPLTGGLLILTP